MKIRIAGITAGCVVGVVACASGLGALVEAVDVDQPDRTVSSPTSVAAGAPVAKPARDVSFLEQYAATRGFTHGTPKSISITPDGKTVLFLRSGPRSFVQDLYAVDTATGQERVLLTAEQLLGGGQEHLTAEELARRERMRLASRGIASYALSKDGTRLLVPLSGRLFVMQIADGVVVELQSKAQGFPIDPQFSPDGNEVACVRDGDLYTINVINGIEKRLTSKTSPTVTNGLAEFVAQEEMDRFHGFWWAPNSQHIVFEQVDTAGMETFHIADPVHPEKPGDEWPYPRPGRKNASVKLGLIDAHDQTMHWLDWSQGGKYEYLAKVVWAKNGPLTVVAMNRAQTDLAVLEIDPDTGASKELLKEHDDAWVNLVPSNPMWLDDGQHFLWMTERGGAWQLEVRKRGTTLVETVTTPDLGLQGIAGVWSVPDQTSYPLGGTHVLVYASKDPTETQILSLPLFGVEGHVPAAPEWTTSQRGVHALVHADGAIGPESPVVWTRALADGTLDWLIQPLERPGPGGKSSPTSRKLNATREDPPWVPRVEWTTVGEKKFNALIVRPRTWKAGEKLPVLVNVYGGPHHQMVRATPQAWYLQQWMADQGFIVVSVDGRGTPNRGRDWERAIKNDLIGPALEDQVEGLKALGAKYPELDLARVGIYGWSFGGYFSAMAPMRRPDVFMAGCAGAPVCDWLDYDTCYTERYLGVPSVGADGEVESEVYRKSSVLTYCKDLTRPLLIIHGTADDNVYFMHSLKMTQALFRSGREFEFLPLAGFTHMVPDPVVTVRLYTRIVDFFESALARQDPPQRRRDTER